MTVRPVVRSRTVRAPSQRTLRFVHATAPSLLADAPPVFVTVPNVEICEVGERWETSTGVFDFTYEDLVSCIQSQDDPGVRTPVVKLGHADPRFDGQPCFGRIEGMRLSENGQTLLGDLVGVPLWLAQCMSTAYPRRSIEGAFEWTTHTGNEWPMVLTGLALLGDSYPAVDTLEDIKALWGATAPPLYPVEDVEEIAASGGFFRARKVDDMPNWLRRRSVAAARQPIEASVSMQDVSNAYYDSLGNMEMWWWIREVRVNPLQLVVDDDEGGLYLVDVNVDASDEITFGEPEQVKIQYVAAGSGKRPGQLVAAMYATREDSGRPARPPATPSGPQTAASADSGRTERMFTAEALAKLGLPADATDEQINAALLALQSSTEPGTGGEGDKPGDKPDGDKSGETTPEGGGGGDAPATTEPGTGGGTGGTGDGGTAAAPTELKIPEGTVLVDETQWADVQEFVAAQRKKGVEDAATERARLVDAAIRCGKFPRARRDHYLVRLQSDPEGARQEIAAMQATIPIKEQGTAAVAPEGMPGGDGTEGPSYPDSWKTSVAASRRGMGSKIKVVND